MKLLGLQTVEKVFPCNSASPATPLFVGERRASSNLQECKFCGVSGQHDVGHEGVVTAASLSSKGAPGTEINGFIMIILKSRKIVDKPIFLSLYSLGTCNIPSS